jgi:hypothetical protein
MINFEVGGAGVPGFSARHRTSASTGGEADGRGEEIEVCGEQISRARFLARTAALGVAAATGPAFVPSRIEGNAAAATRPASPRALRYRGITYEVADGGTRATSWKAARMRNDMRVIREQLHASSVSVFGDGVQRMAATASEAAERGLHVWLQPRLADVPRREILDHLAEVGKHAEEMRRQGAQVHLSVGAEFFLFVPGIVPGDDPVERIQNITSGKVDRRRVEQRLGRFIAQAAKVGRSVFKGRLTYGAAQDDKVDWNLFDVVSVNYYSSFRRRSDYVRELKRYRRWGKPVAITEFGTCAYKGAPRRGGMAWDVVDYQKRPPRIIGNLVRSEETQARYIIRLLDIFESMGLYAAMVYNFVSPDDRYDPSPRYDIDLASYGVVKAIWKTRDKPTSDWHWEPKLAFHALAEHNALAAASTPDTSSGASPRLTRRR